MSDLESLGLSMRVGPPNYAEDRARVVRATIAGRLAEPGRATVLPLKGLGGQPLIVSFHAYGLVGETMVALMLPVWPGARLEVFARGDDDGRTLGTFEDTPDGRREADACGAGAIAALSFVHGELPPTSPSGPGGGPARIRRVRKAA